MLPVRPSVLGRANRPCVGFGPSMLAGIVVAGAAVAAVAGQAA